MSAARHALTLVAVLLAAAPLGHPAHAHPLHTAHVDLAWDAPRHVVLVTVRVFTDDLGLALARRGVRMDAGGVPPAAALAYVRGALILAGDGGRPLPLALRGVQRGERTVTLLLTAPAPAGMRGLRVHSRFLCDLYDDQITIVRVADGHRRRTLLFVNGDGAKLAAP